MRIADFDSAAYKKPINPFSEGQCTWYAFGRIYEMTNKKLSVKGNAGQWWDYAPSKKCFSSPAKQRVACWTGGKGNYGHVLVIENVFSDGSILFSEANYYPVDNKISSDDGKIKSVDSEDELMRHFGSSYTFKGYIGV